MQCQAGWLPGRGNTDSRPCWRVPFADSSRRLGAVMTSEHLAVNEAVVDGRRVSAGYLLPPCQTLATIEVAANHTAAYQRTVDVPFLLKEG